MSNQAEIEALTQAEVRVHVAALRILDWHKQGLAVPAKELDALACAMDAHGAASAVLMRTDAERARARVDGRDVALITPKEAGR